jgi:hypothetical protein
MEESIIQTAEDLFLPVVESATVLASHYANACGRTLVTAQDMQYGMMYAARHVAGKQVGTLFPEIYDEDEEDDDASSWETVDEEDEVFTRYTGDDEMFKKMNECYDTWSEWVPENPMEQALKNAVDAIHTV